MKEKVWIQKGNEFYISDIYDLKKLEPAIYSVKHNQLLGYYLNKEKEKFDFKYKVYGLEYNFINRVEKSFEKSKNNLGVLLYGIKGTGKSVTSKLICNKINLPVICIDDFASDENNDLENFVNSIPQDIIVFIDEYEKKYEYHNDNLLSIMDGSATSLYKRLFILTTNSMNINSNMIGRPSRLRYIKSYSSIEESLQLEIINDLLNDKSKTKELIDFCKTLDIITVDILKSLIEEINLFNQSPEEFYDVFNIKKSIIKFNIFELKNNKKEMFFEKCSSNINELIYSFSSDKDDYDKTLYIENKKIGIAIGVIDINTIKISINKEIDNPFIAENKTKRKSSKQKQESEIKILTFEILK